MSKILEYESLMPAIQALINANNDESNKPPKRSHPYRPRPGRGHNHDSCDACQEGGDLICCDKCPSSFHLGCHDPPLSREDIPSGQWLCHNCKMMKKTLITKSGSVDTLKLEASSDHSRPSSPAIMEEPETIDGLPVFGPQNQLLTKTHFLKRSNSAFSSSRISTDSINEKLTKLTPMEELVRAASLLNPKQFELPREMCITQLFPGDEKVESRNGNAKKLFRNGSKYKPYELDSQSLVPLPAKTCFSCRKSCKKAPLIACDYCPLLFHLDCLDPPLTALPTGMWMCPNHAEHFVDWQALSSMAATERVKIWSRFSQPIDQDTVKAQFLRRVHFGQTPFRSRLKPRPRHRSVIPEMVQYHYKNPPKLLPSLRDVLRCEAVEKRPFLENDWIKNEITDELLFEDIEADVNEIKGAHRIYDKLTRTDDDNVDIKEEVEELDEPESQLPENEEHESKIGVDETQSNKISNTLPKLDIKLIKLLAYQRLQEIIRDNSNLKTSTNFNQELLEAISNSHSDLTKSDLPSRVLPTSEIERIANLFEVTGEESEMAMSLIYGSKDRKLEVNLKREVEEMPRIPFNNREQLIQDKIRARAIFTPIQFKSELESDWRSTENLKCSRFMRYRKLSIGTSSENDLILTDFGFCQQNSEKHAVVFYDESTRSFELLNYSEFGTEVNGQLYSLDFTDHLTPVHKEPSIKEQVLEILDKKRGIKRIKIDDLDQGTRLPAREKYSKLKCNCDSIAPLIAGWEGSAVLSHGQQIKFGCLTFVFSVIGEEDDEDR